MISNVRTRTAKHLPGINSVLFGNEEVMRHDVFAPGALESHHVPGVIDLKVSGRNNNMDPRIVRFRIGTSQHHPIGMIDPRTELPASVDTISTTNRNRIPLP